MLYSLLKKEYVYCEGFIFHPEIPFPITHAWVNIYGKVFDPTLCHEDRYKDIYYLGIPISKKKMLEVCSITGYYGFIDNYHIHKQIKTR